MLKFLKFIPVQFTFFLIIGILFGYYFPLKISWALILLPFLIIISGITYLFNKKIFQNRFFIPTFSFLSFVVIGITAVTFQNQLNWKHHFSKNNAFFLNKPIVATLTITKVLKPTKFTSKYEAQINEINHNNLTGKVLFLVNGDSLQTKFEVGNNLLVQGIFDTISKLNPFGFDYKRYLKNHQIYHQFIASNKAIVKLKNSDNSLQTVAAAFRQKVVIALKKEGFKNDVLAVVNALILGQRTDISDDLLQSYAGAGAMHILAVSGLHIGIILLLLLIIFKPLHSFEYGKIIASVLVILFLWSYAIIAGLSPSVVRAVTMFTALSIGLQLNRPSNIYNTLVISMFFLLLFNPLYLFEIGFQLSYLAVFFIVWLQPKLYNLWEPKLWLLKKIWQLITVSVAAQVGVLPMSLFYFHQFPGLFFLTNLLIIPFLGVILVVGILVILLSLFQIEPYFFTNIYIFMIEKMNLIVTWISNQEAFLIKNITFSLVMVLASYIFIIALIQWFEMKIYRQYVFVLMSIILIQSVLIFEKYKTKHTNQFIVFNTYKNTLIGFRNGSNLQLKTSIKSHNKITNFINSYLVETHLKVAEVDSLIPNVFTFNHSKIVVIDKNGIYKLPEIKPAIVLINDSPKINFERMLKSLKPKMVIADGSNYKSYLNIWEKTAANNNVEFVNTTNSGTYMIND